MKKIHIVIHQAIHRNDRKIRINGERLEIQTNKDNLRFVVFKDEGKQFEIVQQNPKTKSIYAVRARDGEKISWLIPHYFGFRKSDGWKVITDSTTVEEG